MDEEGGEDEVDEENAGDADHQKDESGDEAADAEAKSDDQEELN